MRIRNLIPAVLIAATVSVGAAAPAMAQESPSTTPAPRQLTPAQIERLCDRSDEIMTRLDLRANRVDFYITKATELKSKAEAAGKTGAVEQLTLRLELLNDRKTAIADRLVKLQEQIDTNCQAA